MARAQSDLNSPYTFVKGLITEANRLAESENSMTDGNNVFINRDGSCERRLGFDIETGGSVVTETETLLSDDKAVKAIVWRNVNGDPAVNLIIAQMGTRLHFFDAASNPLSDGYLDTIDLMTYAVSTKAANEPISLATTSMSAIIANKYCDPIWVIYNRDRDELEVSSLVLKIRDFSGLPDGLKIAERPTTISVAHQYNLLNQGWADTDSSTAPDYTGYGSATGGEGSTGGGSSSGSSGSILDWRGH